MKLSLSAMMYSPCPLKVNPTLSHEVICGSPAPEPRRNRREMFYLTDPFLTGLSNVQWCALHFTLQPFKTILHSGTHGRNSLSN